MRRCVIRSAALRTVFFSGTTRVDFLLPRTQQPDSQLRLRALDTRPSRTASITAYLLTPE